MTASSSIITRLIEVDWSLAYTSSNARGRGPERLEGYTLESSHWYTDERGRKLFRIDRYRNAAGEKDMATVRALTFAHDDHRNPAPLKREKVPMRRVLYRLPEVRKAILEGRLIYLCEGEKDVEAFEAHGVTATTAPYGASHWDAEYTKQLEGAFLRIVVDNDPPGWQRLDMLIHELEPVIRSGHVVQAADGLNDASDHFAAGYGLADFVEVHDDSA